MVEAWRRAAAVVGPVDRAAALLFVLRDVGDGAPLGLEEVVDGLVEVFCGVAALGGGDAGEGVAEEARGAEAEVAKSRAAILMPTMWHHVVETAIVRST